MLAANPVALVAAAIMLASAQPSAAGITAGVAPPTGTLPIGCAGQAPSPLAWSCPPFGPAPAVGWATQGPRPGAGPIPLGAIGGTGKHAGASGGAWSGAIPAPSCGAGDCILDLMGAPPAPSGGALLGALSPLLLGCLTLLGALGIRPRA